MLLSIAIIIATSLLGRAAGGGLYVHLLPTWCNRLPELLIALLIGYAGMHQFDSGWLGMSLSSAWAFACIEAGHGTFYTMQGYRTSQIGRIQTLEKIFRPLYEHAGGDIMKPAYSWYMMAIKGLMIALPLGAPAFLIAILFPTAYFLGHRAEKAPAVAEYLAYMFVGCAIALALQ